MNIAPICPVCLSPVHAQPLNTYTAAEAAEHFCPQGRNPDRYQRMQATIRALWQQETCIFVRCETCTHGFCIPFLSGNDTFFAIHNETFGHPRWKWDYTFGLAHIASLGGDRKIMDIGAGSGMFLDKLEPRWQKYAMEGSEQTRAFLRKKGIQVLLPEETPPYEGTFDVVTIFQVLELIADFNSMLSMAYRLLKPGGIIVIAVPDCDAMIWQERVLACPDMPPFHVNKWSPKSLARVLAHIGFAVDDAAMEPQSISNMQNTLHMKISGAAKHGGSLAKRVYAIHNRPLRIVAMLILSGLYTLRYLPQFGTLLKGRHFAITAQKP